MFENFYYGGYWIRKFPYYNRPLYDFRRNFNKKGDQFTISSSILKDIAVQVLDSKFILDGEILDSQKIQNLSLPFPLALNWRFEHFTANCKLLPFLDSRLTNKKDKDYVKRIGEEPISISVKDVNLRNVNYPGKRFKLKFSLSQNFLIRFKWDYSVSSYWTTYMVDMNSLAMKDVSYLLKRSHYLIHKFSVCRFSYREIFNEVWNRPEYVKILEHLKCLWMKLFYFPRLRDVEYNFQVVVLHTWSEFGREPCSRTPYIFLEGKSYQDEFYNLQYMKYFKFSQAQLSNNLVDLLVDRTELIDLLKEVSNVSSKNWKFNTLIKMTCSFLFRNFRFSFNVFLDPLYRDFYFYFNTSYSNRLNNVKVENSTEWIRSIFWNEISDAVR